MLQKAKLPGVAVKQGADSSMASAAQASGGSKGMVRLSKADIRTIIALKPEKLPSADYLDDLAEFFPPEWIEERKRAHAESEKLIKKIDDDFEVFRQQVIAAVRDKGYFEVDEEFMANRKGNNELAAEQQRRMLWTNLDKYVVATPEDKLGGMQTLIFHTFLTKMMPLLKLLRSMITL